MLFLQYVVFTTVSLTGLVVGAHTGGLQGAAWGLNVGGITGLLTMVGLYWYSLRWLGQAEPDHDEETPASGDSVPRQGVEATT
jgi:hypothetical protein